MSCRCKGTKKWRTFQCRPSRSRPDDHVLAEGAVADAVGGADVAAPHGLERAGVVARLVVGQGVGAHGAGQGEGGAPGAAGGGVAGGGVDVVFQGAVFGWSGYGMCASRRGPVRARPGGGGEGWRGVPRAGCVRPCAPSRGRQARRLTRAGRRGRGPAGSRL